MTKRQYLKNIISNHLPAKRQAQTQLASHLRASQRHVRLQWFSDPQHVLCFFKVYLRDAFKLPYGKQHKIMTQSFQVVGELVVTLIARGFSKTTTALAFLIWLICYGKVRNIAWLEHDKTVGQRQVDTITKVFSENAEIFADFGVTQGSTWKPGQGEFSFRVTHEYAIHKEVSLIFGGLRQMIRGAIIDFSRIDYVFIVDVISDADATSRAWNNDVLRIIKSGIMFSGESVNDISVQYQGTILAEGDATDTLSNAQNALCYRQVAIEGDPEKVKALVDFVAADILAIQKYTRDIKGTPPNLKKEKLDLDDMMRYCHVIQPAYKQLFEGLESTWKRHPKFQLPFFVFEIHAVGSINWMRERQHIVKDEQHSKYFREWFVPYTHLDREFVMSCRSCIAIDPSAKDEDMKETNDPQAIVIKLFHPDTKHQYYLHVWEGFRTPFQFIYTIFELMNLPLPFSGCEDLRFRDLPGFTMIFEINQAQRFGLNLIYSVADTELALGDASTYPRDSEAHEKGELRPEAFKNLMYWEVPPVLKIEQHENKMSRLGNPDKRAYAEQRHYHFLPGHSQQDLLVTQYSRFTGKPTHGNIALESKVDGMDADEMGDKFFLPDGYLVEEMDEFGFGQGQEGVF